jgi:hypothetical protein
MTATPTSTTSPASSTLGAKLRSLAGWADQVDAARLLLSAYGLGRTAKYTFTRTCPCALSRTPTAARHRGHGSHRDHRVRHGRRSV